MKLNLFNNRSPYHPFRWMIIITVLVAAFMVYHDLFGGRMFASSRNQQQWNSSGPGSHK